MRAIAVVVMLLGLVLAVTASISGCNALFSWNGRHAVEVFELPEGASAHEIVPQPGRRYTLAVQVVFDRKTAIRREGSVAVEAQVPLVVRVRDSLGTTLANTAGWLDPSEPPSVLYGASTPEGARGPQPELAVERLVGPFTVSSSSSLAVDVDLGPDRVGRSRIVERRLVVHDDRLPPSIRNSFVGAAVGGAAFVVGAVWLVVGWLRHRRGRLKRGGIRSHGVV